MRRSTRVLPACLALAGLAFAACGEAPAPAPPEVKGAWSFATLRAVPAPRAATVHEGDLLVLPAEGRELYLLPRAGLTPQATPRPTRLPLEVVRESRLEGHGSGERGAGLAGQGYRLGVLWDQPLEFVALAVRRVQARGAGRDLEAVYLLERAYGAVWWGRLLRDEAGVAVAVRLEAAFVVPERPRAGAERLDWRDSGAGLAALCLAGSASRDDDLVAFDAEGAGGRGHALHLLDRFGQLLGRWQVELVAPRPPEVRALAWDGTQHLLLIGPGRGELRRVPAVGAAVRVAAEAGVATLEVEGVQEWRALAAAPTGALYLLGSAASGTVVAWRASPTAGR